MCLWPRPAGGTAILMRTGKRRSATVIISRGLPGIVLLFRHYLSLKFARAGRKSDVQRVLADGTKVLVLILLLIGALPRWAYSKAGDTILAAGLGCCC